MSSPTPSRRGSQNVIIPASLAELAEDNISATETLSDFEYVPEEDEVGDYNFDENSSDEEYNISAEATIKIINQLQDDVFAVSVHDSVHDERKQAEIKIEQNRKRNKVVEDDTTPSDATELHHETHSDEDDDILINNGYARKKTTNTLMKNINSIANNYINKINPIRSSTPRDEDMDIELPERERSPTQTRFDRLLTPTRLTPLNLFRMGSPEKSRSSSEYGRISERPLEHVPEQIDFLQIIAQDEANLKRIQDEINQDEIQIVLENEHGQVVEEPTRKISFAESPLLPTKCDRKGFILELPDDTLVHILQFLYIGDYSTISLNLTCKSWYTTCSRDQLWQEAFTKFVHNKSHQKHSGLLTYVSEFTTSHESHFRSHLIHARKQTYRFKIRAIAEDTHETLRKYLFLNSLVLAPLVFLMCLMTSTMLVGAYADGYLSHGIYVFIPQFVAMLTSLQGSVSFLVRETIMFRHGFYDAVHLFNFLILTMMPLTFYVTIMLVIFKLFILPFVPWTVHMIPCLIVYVVYCAMTLGVVLRRYSKRRREFRRVVDQLEENSKELQGTEILYEQQERRKRLDEAKNKLFEWQRHRVYTRSRYVVQPESEHFVDSSDDEELSSESIITIEEDTASQVSENSTEKTEEEQADEETLKMVTRIQRNDDVSVIVLYCSLGMSLLCVALEIIVLPLKMDNYITASWGVCLIPMWFLLGTLIVGIPSFVAWQLLTDTGMTELLYSLDPRYAKSGRRRKSKQQKTDVIGGLRWSRIRKLFANTKKHNYDNEDDDTEKDVGFCAFSAVPVCLFAPGVVALGLITANLSGMGTPMLAGTAVLAFWELLLGGFFIIFALPFALSRNTGF